MDQRSVVVHARKRIPLYISNGLQSSAYSLDDVNGLSYWFNRSAVVRMAEPHSQRPLRGPVRAHTKSRDDVPTSGGFFHSKCRSLSRLTLLNASIANCTAAEYSYHSIRVLSTSVIYPNSLQSYCPACHASGIGITACVACATLIAASQFVIAESQVP